MGLCIPERPVRKKLPIAYSYNGVVLPELPNLNRPYAVVTKNVAEGTYWLRISAEKTYQPEFAIGLGNYITPTPSDLYGIDGDGWSLLRTEEEGSTTVQLGTTDFVWANHDILSNEDTVYLEASKPIPVYE